MLVLGLDIETDGLDTASARMIELGAVLWDTERSMPLRLLSLLVRPVGWDGEIFLPENIRELTGIEPKDIATYGRQTGYALEALGVMAANAVWVMGHNGLAFDRPILLAECNRAGITFANILPQPWMDSSMDLPFPKGIIPAKLSFLAAQAPHSFLNPFSHRAIFDTLTMLKMASSYDWSEIAAHASSPVVKLVAKVPFNQKELPKAAKFYWDGTQRHWFKFVRQAQVPALKLDFEFAMETVR